MKRPAKDKKSRDENMSDDEDIVGENVVQRTSNEMKVQDHEYFHNGKHWVEDEDSDISDWFASDEDKEKKAGDAANVNNIDTSLPESSFSNDYINVNGMTVDDRSIYLANIIDGRALPPSQEHAPLPTIQVLHTLLQFQP